MVARTNRDEIEVDAVVAAFSAGIIDLAEGDEDWVERDEATEGRQDDDWLPAGSAHLGIP
jgi:hypothetical protein